MRRPMRCRLIGVVLALSFPAATAAAQAAPPRITDNEYALDVYEGPVTTTSRIIGVAGAYTAVAEDCEGALSNAAAPAIRPAWSTSRWAWDVCLDFTNPGAFGNVDVENRGPRFESSKNRYSNAFSLTTGLELQYRSVGITLIGSQTRYGLGDQDVFSSQYSMLLSRITTSIANSFADDQLALGVGLKIAVLDIDQRVDSSYATVVSSAGVGFQVGAIYKPKKIPLRLGATFRSKITIADVPGDFVTAEGHRAVGPRDAPFLLPDRVELPWELELGAAVELGSRPFNRVRPDASFVEDALRAGVDERRFKRASEYEATLSKLAPKLREARRKELERAEEELQEGEERELEQKLDQLREAQRAEANLWSRGQVMLLTSVVITGNTVEGVDIADGLGQVRVTSGNGIVFSPRLALETEVVPRWFTARGGVYMEPGRIDGSDPRAHLTLGADVRLFKFNPFGLFGDDPWRIRVANDFAPRYFNYGLSIGKYH